MNIEVNKEYLQGLRIAYNKATKEGADQFKYKGNDFVTAYAKYFLEYWEGRFNIKQWLDEDHDPLIEIYKDLKFMADKADSPLTKAAFGVALTICEDHLSTYQYPNPHTHLLLNKTKNN